MTLDGGLRAQLADSLDWLRCDLPDRAADARTHKRGVAPQALRIDPFRIAGHSRILELGAALEQGDLTSEGLVASLLAAADRLDGTLHVYATRFDDLALLAARTADAERRAGRVRGPLHGIPVAVKDVLATVEAITTSNCRVSAVHITPQDATAVNRLRAAGAVVIGKSTTMELACGMPDAAAGDPVPRNPWSTEHWTGGSSSGSAAGVAAQLFPAALGTDTAGSIRTPAALCGVTGFKPTNDPHALGGCLPLAPDLDSIGPLAESAVDCALLLDAIAPTIHPPGELDNLEGVRIAAERQRFQSPDVHPDIRRAFDAALRTLEEHGAHIHEVVLPHYDLLRVASRVVWTTEAFTRYGQHSNALRPPTRDLLAVGAMHTAADYARARNAQIWARAEYTDLLAPYGGYLSPTRTCLAPKVREATIGWQMSNHNHASIWNLLGFPAVSVPMGLSTTGLPLGLQIVGCPSSDRQTLALAAHFQSLTDCQRRPPPLVHEESIASPREASAAPKVERT